MSLGPMMVDLEGHEIQEEEKDILRHPLVGGVILFARNFENLEQLKHLVTSIQKVRKPSLMVSVDQEGGRVQRFRDGFTRLPPPSRLGEIYDQDHKQGKALAEVTGWLMAMELLAVGIDYSFAPVLDLGRGISTVIGDRAFHSDPQIITELASSYVAGMMRAGMGATGKHFPGHGTVLEDSHISLPVDDRSFEEIANTDLTPFARMIHFGLSAIMPAHVIYSKVDEKPAGFSEFWVKEVLRKRLGFRGMVVSDDLSMKAAGCVGDFGERAKLALNAGCDTILVCNDHDAVDQVLSAISGYKSDPASIMRRSRMRGKRFLTWDRLAKDPHWQQAVEKVRAYSEGE